MYEDEILEKDESISTLTKKVQDLEEKTQSELKKFKTLESELEKVEVLL